MINSIMVSVNTAFQDNFIVPFMGQNLSVSNLNDLFAVHQTMRQAMFNDHSHHVVKRRYQIYERKEPEKKSEGACPSTGGISAFTFINFLLGVVSIAANVLNNNNNNNNVRFQVI